MLLLSGEIKLEFRKEALVVVTLHNGTEIEGRYESEDSLAVYVHDANGVRRQYLKPKGIRPSDRKIFNPGDLVEVWSDPDADFEMCLTGILVSTSPLCIEIEPGRKIVLQHYGRVLHSRNSGALDALREHELQQADNSSRSKPALQRIHERRRKQLAELLNELRQLRESDRLHRSAKPSDNDIDECLNYWHSIKALPRTAVKTRDPEYVAQVFFEIAVARMAGHPLTKYARHGTAGAFEVAAVRLGKSTDTIETIYYDEKSATD